MANRYQYTKIKKDKRTKNRVHDTTFYPKIVESDTSNFNYNIYENIEAYKINKIS